MMSNIDIDTHTTDVVGVYGFNWVSIWVFVWIDKIWLGIRGVYVNSSVPKVKT